MVRLGESDDPPDGIRADDPGAVPRGSELPFRRNSTPAAVAEAEALVAPDVTGELSALPALLLLALVRFMLLNMSLTAPTRLPAPPPLPAWGLAVSFESLTWSRFRRDTGLGLGKGLGRSP